MSERTRVVITGMGMVTPLGHDAESTWEGMREGRNGVGPISHFDAYRLADPVAHRRVGADPRRRHRARLVHHQESHEPTGSQGGRMIRYVVRRMLYAVPTLIGVLLLTFAIFFLVHTPEQLARANIATKNPTPKAIKTWLHDRGYDKPQSQLFKEQFTQLAVLDFGKSDRNKEPIWDRVKAGAGPSGEIAGPLVMQQPEPTATGTLLSPSR